MFVNLYPLYSVSFVVILFIELVEKYLSLTVIVFTLKPLLKSADVLSPF